MGEPWPHDLRTARGSSFVETVFGIIVGCVAMVVGLVVIIKRRAFSKFSADAQRATFGRVGDKVADRANPGWTGAVGGFFFAVGAVLVILMLAGVEM